MWGVPVNIPHDFNEWGRVFKLAHSQSVLPMVADVMLSDDTVVSSISAKGQEKLRSFMMVNMVNADRMSLLIEESVCLLRKAGTDPVLMKGHAVSRYYPNPRLRQCGDVDLYVGVEDYRKAYEAFEKAADSIEEPEVLDIGQHFSAFFGGLQVEVHRYAEVYPSRRLNARYQEFSQKGLSEDLVPMEVRGISVNTPSDTYNCYYLFSHMFNHFLSGGIGFRHLADWAMFLSRNYDKLDMALLEDMVTSMGMMKPWQAFGYIVVNYLDLPADSLPFYSGGYDRNDIDRIVRAIFEEGNFGHQRDVHKKKGGNYLIDKTRSFFGHISRSAGLVSLFPSIVCRRFFLTMYNRFSKVFTDIKTRSKA